MPGHAHAGGCMGCNHAELIGLQLGGSLAFCLVHLCWSVAMLPWAGWLGITRVVSLCFLLHLVST